MIIVGHVLDGKSTESVRWSYSVEPAFPVADCAGFKCLRSCWRESCVQCRGGGHPSRNSSTFQHYYDDKHWVGGYGLSLLEDLATTPHVWFGTSRGTGKEVAVLDLYPGTVGSISNRGDVERKLTR